MPRRTTGKDEPPRRVVECRMLGSRREQGFNHGNKPTGEKGGLTRLASRSARKGVAPGCSGSRREGGKTPDNQPIAEKGGLTVHLGQSPRRGVLPGSHQKGGSTGTSSRRGVLPCISATARKQGFYRKPFLLPAAESEDSRMRKSVLSRGWNSGES